MSQGARVIPIFPLSSVVLFPQVRCPLHIFEPRYRQMTAHALAGDGVIGMVTVHPQETGGIQGDPPVFEVGCAGTITENQELPDGRYNLVLSGTYRFRVLHEPPRPTEQLFRTAEVVPLEDAFDEGDVPRVKELRSRVLELSRQLLGHIAPDRVDSFAEGRLERVEDAVLVNALSNSFPLEPAEKQQLLEADSVKSRFERLEDLLVFNIADIESLGGSGTEHLH